MPWAEALRLGVGLALLVTAGGSLVRGASELARRFGIPPLVVGLTVVAFGTSLPELAVNVTAAVRGNGAVGFGNVIGSNLANVGLILACAALVRSLRVDSVVVTRELPMLLLASVAAFVMGSDGLRGQAASGYDRADGLMFFLLFAVFLYYTIGETLRRRSTDPFVDQAREHAPERGLPARASGARAVFGIVGLAAGGQLTVTGAVGLAEALGAPRELIGLTLVAIGTSLPELSASVIAARRGESELAIGNVVGSNIFNLLFVLGLTAVIAPVPVPPSGGADLAMMVGFAAALLLLALSRHRIGRREGAMLLVTYVAYLAWRLL